MKRKLSITKILTSLLSLLLLTSIVSSNVFAEDQKETFTMDAVDGKPEQYVKIGDRYSVVYCMQYDYVIPATREGMGSGVAGGSTTILKTMYWEADKSEMLLDDDKLKIIQKVLYAGYPYDSVGALEPLYSLYGQAADSFASDLTQHIIWSFMKEWGIEANDHYGETGSGFFDVDGWTEAYENVMDFVNNGKISSITNDFKPELNGSVAFKENEDTYATGKLFISNPEGLRLQYKINVPENVKIVDESGNNLYLFTDFITNEKYYLIYGAETFVLVADDPDGIADKNITFTTAVKAPTDVKQYNTKDGVVARKDWYEKGDSGVIGQYTPYQTMLGVDVSTKELSGSAKLEVAEDVGSVTISKVITEGSEEAAKGIDFKFNVVIKDEDVNPVEGKFPTEKHCGVAGRDVITGEIETDENGKCQIELQGGDHIRIDGLPLDSTVTVTEVEVKGWSAVVSSGTEDGEMYITITNTYDPTADTDPAGGNGSGTNEPGDKPSEKPEGKPGNSGSGSATTYVVPDTSCK